ncbi:MAG: hypothetical protein R6X13_05345 [bacterium]
MNLKRLAAVNCACAAVLATVFSAGCAGRAARGAGPSARILVTRSLGDEAMLRAAALARSERERGEYLWLVAGTGLQGTSTELLSDGASAVDRLDVLGVDAALFGPAWLGFGPDRSRVLADRARCFLLGANITDTVREAFGHGLMVMKTAVGLVGLAGVWPDSSDPFLRQGGVRFTGPGYAAAAILPVLRQRCDFAGLVSASRLDPAPPGWDIVMDAEHDSVVLYELSLTSAGILSRRLPVAIDGVTPDSGMAARLAAIAAAVDGVTLGPGPTMAATAFNRALGRVLLDAGKADCLLFDDSLWKGGAVAPGLGRAELAAGLTEPGRWARVSLASRRLNDLVRARSLTVVRRSARTAQGGGTLTVLMPPSLAVSVLESQDARYDLTDRMLWAIAEEFLQSGRQN